MIGENINRIRKERGITLTVLAEKAMISKSNLSNIERNINKNPSIKVLEKLAEVLNTDIITLLGIQDNNSEQYEIFINKLNDLNVTKEDLQEYEKVIEFIEWQKREI
ncbi:helix-turn-helix domain-containing protein [Alkalicoccus halolimnae]|uniref:Helix-turn-helix transcriptional regulator n=1 Tax=Alkalicoccus halolimnae TaxID=1667239 RepID=A0A5C7F9S5_9BACI|nr:helix-turn-helix transcriptional regulator [Alkalicoccus halolimnae]TXF87511.1 helix-turn-helix transcriptional regulator [Alkalicoccus halolimnae]